MGKLIVIAYFVIQSTTTVENGYVYNTVSHSGREFTVLTSAKKAPGDTLYMYQKP